MKNTPVKIYLQAGEPDETVDFNEIAHDGSVTWCTDKIQESDIPYLKESAVMEVFAWLLGYKGDFPARKIGDAPYYWRPALRRKLIMAGIQFIEPKEEDDLIF